VTTTTLLDGRVVDAASPEYAAECLERRPHVEFLLSLRGTPDARARRNQYLARLEHQRGEPYAQRVAEAVKTLWKLEPCTP